MILPASFINHYGIVNSWFLIENKKRFYINLTQDRGYMALEVYPDGGEGEIDFFDTYSQARSHLKEKFKITKRMKRLENPRI